jgi:Flp pilus assembly CpaE family ATPase
MAGWTVVDTGFGTEADEELSFDAAVPRRNAATLSALHAADLVIAVGSADPVGLHRLVRGLQDLSELLPPGTQPKVVITRVRVSAVGRDPQGRITRAMGRFAGVPHVHFVPDDRAGYDRALLLGRSLAEVSPGSPARRALQDLTRDVIHSLTGAVAPDAKRFWRLPWPGDRRLDPFPGRA